MSARIAASALALALIVPSSGAVADASIAEAQRLLNSMGYNPGPADGAFGKRTNEAITNFLSDRGQAFDGSIGDEELVLLRGDAPEYVVELRHPGRLFDRTYGQQSRCNGFSAGFDILTAQAMDRIQPIRAFNDATSIGRSVQRNTVDPWLQQLVLLAVRADTMNDDASATLAVAQLRKWAQASAFAETAVDRRYGGAGDGGSYDEDAPAPILDMENALRAAQVALYSLEMLGERIPETDRSTISDWALGLLRKFAPQFGSPRRNPRADGIWSYDARPAMILAIAEGNAGAYAGFVDAFYALFRDRIADDGAILRNAERGDRAIVYQSLGINSMASVLDLIESQGSRVPADIEQRLHRAVSFLLRADRDSSVIAPYAKVGFDNPGRGDNPERFYRTDPSFLWWAPWYLSHYPDHENAQLLRVFLAEHSTRVGIDRQPLTAITYPYPINCCVPFDLSEASVERARSLVTARYSTPAADAAPAAVADSFTAEAVSVTNYRQQQDSASFTLAIRGAKLGGVDVSFRSVDVIAEFIGDANNLQTLRIAFIADTLDDVEGRKADYSRCHPMSRYNRPDTRLDLLLHLGFDEELNECILSKLGPNDRRKWEGLLANFDGVIEALAPSKGADVLRQFYAQLP